MAKLEDLYTGIFIAIFIVAMYIFIYYHYCDIDKSSLLKTTYSGVIRGFLMGIILGGLDGAIATSITLGTINPIVYYMENIG